MKFLVFVLLFVLSFSALATKAPYHPYMRAKLDEIESEAKEKTYVFNWTQGSTVSATGATVALGSLPANCVVSQVKAHVKTGVQSANDNVIDVGCEAAGDIVQEVDLTDTATGAIFYGTVNISATSAAGALDTGTDGCDLTLTVGAGDNGDITDAGIEEGDINYYIKCLISE
jgi:hypothetical protein